MALSDKEQTAIWQGWLDIVLTLRGTGCPWPKPVVKSFPVPVDTWLNSLATKQSFNAVIPEPLKTDATVDEKALMLALGAFGTMKPEFRGPALKALGRLLNGS